MVMVAGECYPGSGGAALSFQSTFFLNTIVNKTSGLKQTKCSVVLVDISCEYLHPYDKTSFFIDKLNVVIFCFSTSQIIGVDYLRVKVGRAGRGGAVLLLGWRLGKRQGTIPFS
jgi:hypothetical protein